MPSEAEIEAAAAVIDEMTGYKLGAAVPSGEEIVRAALEAAERVREPIVFVTSDHFGPQLRCTVNGPAHIIVEPVDRADG